MPMIESVNEFVRLLRSEDPGERKRSAWDEAPIEVWREMLDGDPDLHFWVAHNRTIPEEIMVALARDAEPRVRRRLADKNSCSAGVLEMLARDEDELVVSAVAGHPKTPVDALNLLSEHAWVQVREKAQRQLADRGK